LKLTPFRGFFLTPRMAKKKSAKKATKSKKSAPKKRKTGVARRRANGTMTFYYGR
jgi:hypothetical protein